MLLYFLVSGAYPVRGRTLAEIKRAHAMNERASPRAARPDLPDALVSIIETLLATDPDERYQSAGAAEAALRRCLEQPPAAQRRVGGRLAAAAVVGAMVLAAVSAGALWRYRSHSPTDSAQQSASALTLKPGDWIVVADFDNRTGESVLDGTLRAAVDRELEYSDFVRVAQRDRIEDALKLLERPLDSRLDRDLALQLSQRDGGIHAVVSGAIAKADSGYTLTLDIINPATGTPLPTLTDHAPAQSDVLAAVRRQVLRIRETFGEPATSIERSREAFQRAALPSLEALNLFAQAKAMINLRPVNPVSEWVTIEKIAREVIQADAAFPGGPILLAWALTNQSRGKEGQEHRERALLLADNATPQERYFIIASVHGANARGPGGGRLPQRNREQPTTRWANIAQPRELEKAAAAMEALFALQPDHYAIKGNLRNVYQLLGRERDLAWMNLRLADARPWSVDVNLEVANQLLREGNVDGARRYGARAESALSPGSSAADPNLAAGVRLFRAYVAWLQDDPAETLRTLNQVAASAAKLPDTERRQLYLRIWSLYAAVGRLQEAEQAIEAIRPADPNDLENTIVADMARADLFEDRGDVTRLRELAATAWRDPLPATARPMLANRVPFLD